jgi:hypothetical protein
MWSSKYRAFGTCCLRHKNGQDARLRNKLGISQKLPVTCKIVSMSERSYSSRILSRIPVKPETAIVGCCSLLRQREAPCELVVEPTPPTGHVLWDNNVVKNFKALAEIAELLKTRQ